MMLIRINIKNTSLNLFLVTCTTMIGITHILNIDSCSIPKFHVFVCHTLSINIGCRARLSASDHLIGVALLRCTVGRTCCGGSSGGNSCPEDVT